MEDSLTVNRGIAPPEFSTPTGQFRALVNDTEYAPLDPAEVGYGNYSKFSDDEIEVFLLMSDGDLAGAAYFAFTQLAGEAALQSKSVKDFDLQVDLTKRSAELRQVASNWKSDWEAGTSDVFELSFPAGNCCRVGEASPVPVYCGSCRGC